MPLPELRPRLPFLGLAGAAVMGIVLADRCALPVGTLLGCALLAAATALAWNKTGVCWIFAALVFAALHTFRENDPEMRSLAAALAEGRQVVRATGIVWSEPEPLPFWSRQQTGRFRLKLEQLDFDGRSTPLQQLVHVTWCGALPRYGDRVTFLGSARQIEPVRNPGEFDFPAYLRRQGIRAQIEARFASDCEIHAHDCGSPAQAFAIRARHWLAAQLALDLDDSPEIASLITSMVLGLRGDTPEDMQELFRRTGTLHLFAVSGLNIAMLALIAWFVLKPLGIRRRGAVIAIVPILATYALVTGLTASCVRAAIMGSLILLAQLFDRRAVVYNSLAAAAVLILAWDTNQLFSPGFQFSFVLVAVIVWLARRIQRFVEPLGTPDAFLPKPLWNWRQRSTALVAQLFAAALGVTLSAWLGSLLFTVGYFHLFSPSAIVANMLAVPIAFAILALGLGTALTAAIAKPVALLFNNANWACAKVLLWTVKTFALLPGGYIYVELPRHTPPPDCEFTVLAVGEGAAVHLRADGTDWLIDGGSTQRYGAVTLPYLRSRGVNVLDAFLLTHGDAQHIGCAGAVLDDFAPRRIYDSPLRDRSPTRRAFHEALAARNRGLAFCQSNDVLPLGRHATLRVLYPPAGLQRGTADDKTLVLLLQSGRTRALFTSDSGFPTEQWLLANKRHLRADVLIRGEPAKDFSGTADFLAQVAPQVVVCPPPKFGDSGESMRAWARTTEAKGVAVFLQEDCGAVSVAIRGDEFEVQGFVKGQTFRGRAR